MAINKDTVSFIEDIIGITGSISQGIQQQSNKRNEVFVSRINDIIGITGGGTPLYRRFTDNGDILEVKDRLELMEDEIKQGGDITTEQYYKSIINDVNLAMDDNVLFQKSKLEFTNPDNQGIEDLIKTRVDDYVALQNSYAGDVDPAQKAKAAHDIKELLVTYGNKKEKFVSYFGDRVTKDADLYSSIMTVEAYSKFILQEMLYPADGGVGIIDEETHRMFQEGLFEGNMTSLDRFMKKENTGRAASIQTILNELDDAMIVKNEMDMELITIFGKTGNEQDIAEWVNSGNNNLQKDYEDLSADEKRYWRGRYTTARSNYETSQITPIANKIKQKDNAYSKLTGYSYIDLSSGKPIHDDVTLPKPILNVMAKMSNDSKYALYDGRNKNLKSIYTTMIKDIQLKESQGIEWYLDEKIADALEGFADDYEEINKEIKANEKAKARNYESILSIDNYKDVDIKLIEKYIDKLEV